MVVRLPCYKSSLSVVVLDTPIPAVLKVLVFQVLSVGSALKEAMAVRSNGASPRVHFKYADELARPLTGIFETIPR